MTAMRRIAHGAAVAVMLAVLATGCIYQPYGDVHTWLMRDNAIPQYFANYDIFFVHRAGFDWEIHDTRVVALYDSLKMNVKEPFGRHVRVFAPLLHDDVDIQESELALGYYLDTFHDDGRPFVIFVEGRDANFVTNFFDACESMLNRENGYAYFHYHPNGTLQTTPELKELVKRRVDDLIYERKWHRQHPPEDLAKALDLDVLAGLPLEVMTDDAPSMRDSFKRIPLRYKSATNRTANAESAVAPVAETNEVKETHHPVKKMNTFEMTLEDILGTGNSTPEEQPATDDSKTPAARPPSETPVEMSMGIPEKVAEERRKAAMAAAENGQQAPERVPPPGAQDPEPNPGLPIDVPPIDTTPIDTTPRPAAQSGANFGTPAVPTAADLFGSGAGRRHDWRRSD